MAGQGVSSFQINFTQKINLGITEIVEFTTRSTPSTYYSVLYLIKKRAWSDFRSKYLVLDVFEAYKTSILHFRISKEQENYSLKYGSNMSLIA